MPSNRQYRVEASKPRKHFMASIQIPPLDIDFNQCQMLGEIFIEEKWSELTGDIVIHRFEHGSEESCCTRFHRNGFFPKDLSLFYVESDNVLNREI